MENFIGLYNELLTHPERKQELSTQLYRIAFDLCENATTIVGSANQQGGEEQLKEFIISKVIYFFPEDSKLYNMMGKMLMDKFADKALMWLKLCYTMNPYDLDNILDLCTILSANSKHKSILDLNVDNLFDSFLHNTKFLTFLYQANKNEDYYENVEKYLLTLLDRVSEKKVKSYDDKKLMCQYYMDLGNVYGNLCNNDVSIDYTLKCYELTKEIKCEKHYIVSALQNYLAYNDYIYPDNAEIFKKYLELNDWYENVQLFSFEKRKKKRRMRIGYVSSDMLHHAVANFLLPILQNHNKTKFDIFLYPNTATNHEWFSSLKIPTYNISQMTDKEAAKLINVHEIDILIDLNGISPKNRLDVFALNPAPIQMTYMGYPNTTGLKFMHYRITDNFADNEFSTQQYSEKLVRLPKCFLLYKSVNQQYPQKPKKTKETVVLGALNKEAKNSKYVLEAWKTILNDCPNTKIMIKLESYDNLEERTAFYTNKLNVHADRLILLTKMSNEAYNESFTKIDLLLDTFPYSGTTTTCNALYNSVPVVTHYNKDYHAHNVSSSILINSELKELVAYSTEEYIQIAKDLVSNPIKIETYKSSILKKFMRLMEPTQFMKSYEEALEDVYNKYEEEKQNKKDDQKINISA